MEFGRNLREVFLHPVAHDKNDFVHAFCVIEFLPGVGDDGPAGDFQPQLVRAHADTFAGGDEEGGVHWKKVAAAVSSANAPDDARLVQVVLGHFHFHAVADGEPDEALAHLAGNGREKLVLVVQLDAKHRSGQHGLNSTFNFYMFFHELKQL